MIMMRKFSVVALGWVALGACATKGYVRQQVTAATDTSRAAWTAADNALKSSLTADMTAEFSKIRLDIDSVKSSVATLRTDLNGLRTDFGARVTAMEAGMQFAFPVTFAFDDATVRDQDRRALDRFVQVVNKHYAGSIVTVEGFADPAGSPGYNRRLSEERAENVIAYLTQAGISGVTLRPVGMGETRLVVEGASDDMPGAESNRRVVFVVESTGRPATTAGMP